MKSGEVKSQKQNYLVFLRNCLPSEFSCRHPVRFYPHAAFLHTHG